MHQNRIYNEQQQPWQYSGQYNSSSRGSTMVSVSACQDSVLSLIHSSGRILFHSNIEQTLLGSRQFLKFSGNSFFFFKKNLSSNSHHPKIVAQKTMCCVMFTLICCNCMFQPDIFDFNQWLLSYIQFVWDDLHVTNPFKLSCTAN